MKTYSWFILLILIFSCHKNQLMQDGLKEVKLFQWTVNEEMNQLTVKFSPDDMLMETVETVIVRISVEQLELENIYQTPTIKIDPDDMSPYHGRKIVELNWIPSLDITPTNVEYVRVFVK
jgi:hypothetical protein